MTATANQNPKPKKHQKKPNNHQGSANNKKRKPVGRRPIRQAVREETAGGVVFRRGSNGQVQFLLISDAKNRWTIPKGHVEPGEKTRDTAKREVHEETGLAEVEVLDWLDKIRFQYRREDNLILMAQHNYLVRALGDTNDTTKEEWMTDLKWMDASEALEAVEYEQISRLFLLGLKKIRANGY